MTLRSSVTFTDPNNQPVDAPFAADLFTRMSSGALSRGRHCASDWLELLDTASHTKLRDNIGATVQGTASREAQMDVVATTWLLMCLEDESLPLQPAAGWVNDAGKANDLVESLHRLAVMTSMDFWRRNGDVQFDRMRISDAELPHIQVLKGELPPFAHDA